MVPGCASSLQPNLPKASQRRGHRFSKHAPLWQCMIPASGCSIPQSLRFLRYVRYLELHLWHQKETFQSFHIIVRGPYWLLMSWVGGLQTSGVRAPLPSCEKTASDVTWHDTRVTDKDKILHQFSMGLSLEGYLIPSEAKWGPRPSNMTRHLVLTSLHTSSRTKSGNGAE